MKRKLKILLVEDDSIEIMKLQRTVASLQWPHQIIEARNGEEALETLEQMESLPDLIFLDLNMPKLNGIDFLRIMKTRNKMKHLPVVILTTSSNQCDIRECYQLGIAGYLIKPLGYDDYVSMMKTTIDYWIKNEFTEPQLT